MPRSLKTIRHILSRADWPLVPSATAETILAALERRMVNRKLPTTFRELWSLENGPDFLARYSNSDQPLSPSGLGEPAERWPGYDPLADDVLPFMVENQGICAWGIRLDGDHDDPAVMVEVDSGTPPHWRECAGRFSDWLTSQVEDALLLESYWFGARGPTLDDTVLAQLYDRFGAGVQTSGWPGSWNYRFHSERARLLLWNSDGQCDWWIAPRSADVALATIDEIDSIAAIGKSLYAPKDEHAEVLCAWLERGRDG